MIGLCSWGFLFCKDRLLCSRWRLVGLVVWRGFVDVAHLGVVANAVTAIFCFD